MAGNNARRRAPKGKPVGRATPVASKSIYTPRQTMQLIRYLIELALVARKDTGVRATLDAILKRIEAAEQRQSLRLPELELRHWRTEATQKLCQIYEAAGSPERVEEAMLTNFIRKDLNVSAFHEPVDREIEVRAVSLLKRGPRDLKKKTSIGESDKAPSKRSLTAEAFNGQLEKNPLPMSAIVNIDDLISMFPDHPLNRTEMGVTQFYRRLNEPLGDVLDQINSRDRYSLPNAMGPVLREVFGLSSGVTEKTLEAIEKFQVEEEFAEFP